MTFFLKDNTATNRRVQKLKNEGVDVDTSTHEGRVLIGYSYIASQVESTVLKESFGPNRAQRRQGN